MKKLWIALSIVVIMLVSACGASSDKSAETTSMNSSVRVEEEAAMEAPQMDMAFDEMVESGEASLTMLEESDDFDYDNKEEDGDGLSYERKIIKTGFVYMETLDFESTISGIKKMVAMYNGYTAYSESNGGSVYEDGYNTRYARFSIKVPAAMFEEMYEGLHSIGNVLNSNEGRQDVTSQFVDIEARLLTLKVQEERLLSILERSETLEDIIELEYALQDTRYEIERYTTNLRKLEDQVKYSTIDITVQEVFEVTEIEKPVITFRDKITSGLAQTFKEISQGAQNLVIFLVTQFPYLIFMVVVLAFGRWLYKHLSRKEKLKKAERKAIKESQASKEE